MPEIWWSDLLKGVDHAEVWKSLGGKLSRPVGAIAEMIQVPSGISREIERQDGNGIDHWRLVPRA